MEKPKTYFIYEQHYTTENNCYPPSRSFPRLLGVSAAHWQHDGFRCCETADQIPRGEIFVSFICDATCIIINNQVLSPFIYLLLLLCNLNYNNVDIIQLQFIYHDGINIEALYLVDSFGLCSCLNYVCKVHSASLTPPSTHLIPSPTVVKYALII